jgi:glycosyltransferase involved in cell wall biosynthesis
MKNNKVKILFVDEAVSFGGSLTVLRTIVTNLKDKKISPIILTSLPSEVIKEIMPDTLKILKYKKIVTYQQKKDIFGKVRRLKNKILKSFSLKLTMVCLNIVRIMDLFRLLVIIKKLNVDLVYSNNCQDVLLVSWLLNLKRIRHLHGDNLVGFGMIDKMAIRRVNLIIAISEHIKQVAIRNGINKNKVIRLYNPIPKFEKIEIGKIEKIREKYQLKKAVIISIFGRIVRWKGHIELLHAISLINHDIEFKLMVVGDCADGDSNYLNEIDELIDRKRIRDRIVFCGYVNDVHNYYQCSDIVVHCSIEPEPFGMVIIEAMSLGVPVIVSDRGAPTELVRHGIDGYIVDPSDDKRIAAYLERLILDKKLRLAMGDHAKKSVKSVFDIDLYIKKIESLFEETINAK